MSSRWSSLALVGVAVLAISSSAVLVRWADAPAEALAFWRTLGGALILGGALLGRVMVLALGRRRSDVPADRWPDRPPARRPRPADRWGIVVAGLALAVHFSTWLASLELTSVAASVTLVTTAPLMIALGSAVTGRRPPARTWLAIVVAIVGAAIITLGGASAGGPGSGSTVGTGPPSPTTGNVLALVGAAAMAVYLVAGDRVRANLTTTAYASRAYGVAAGALVVYCLVAGIPLAGYDDQTWLAIAAMVLGPQLAGHTVLNLLLQRLGSVTVSTVLLVEPVGAGLLAWLLFGEVPPLAAWIGAPLVIGAVAVQVRGPAEPGTRPVSAAGRRGAGTPGPGG